MTNNQRFAAEIATLLLIGAVIVAQAKPHTTPKDITAKNIRAESIDIVDKKGKVRVAIGIKDGVVAVNIMNAKGEPQSIFGSGEVNGNSVSILRLGGEKNHPGAEILIAGDDAILNVGDYQRHSAVSLGASNEESFVTLFDTKKKERVHLQTGKPGGDSGPFINIVDENGKTAFAAP